MVDKYVLKGFKFTEFPVSLVTVSNVWLKELIYLGSILSAACSTWRSRVNHSNYSLFTLRRPRSPLILNWEQGLLRVNILYISSVKTGLNTQAPGSSCVCIGFYHLPIPGSLWLNMDNTIWISMLQGFVAMQQKCVCSHMVVLALCTYISMVRPNWQWAGSAKS